MAKLAYRLVSVPPRLVYALGLGRLLGRLVLLLTTRGRRTGKLRVTPLQYEAIGDDVFVGSARGTAADWYRNLVVDPRVEVRVGGRRFAGMAETCVAPGTIADFMEFRLRRRPRTIGRILRAAGLGPHPSRAELEGYAAGLALVRISPISEAQPRQADWATLFASDPPPSRAPPAERR